MTRTLVHVGLAVVFVIAPTLCCCKARGHSAAAHAASPSSQPTQNPQSEESCCKKVRACCHDETEPPAVPGRSEPAPHHNCACNAERPDAAQTESKPTVAAAEPTGELVALPHAALVASPEHRGPNRGARPPDAGADAKSAALFDRHVMRC